MKLESETPGQDYLRKRRRNLRKGFIAMTWSRWYCWSTPMPDDPPWALGGMIWRYNGVTGQIQFGHS